MRYYIIINPPQYQENAEDTRGYAWAGEAKDADDAKAQAIAQCEFDNNWGEHDTEEGMGERSAIDPDDTDVIECGPDYAFYAKEIVAEIKAFDAKCEEAQETDTGEVWELLHSIRDRLAFDHA